MAISAPEGNAHTSGSAGSTSLSLTTTAAGVVVVSITYNTSAQVTSVTSASLTFTKHATSDLTANHIEVWTAPSSGSLSSESITITLPSAGFRTIDVFGIPGADESTIFDGDASVPDTGTSGSGTISTATDDDIIIGAFRITSATSTPSTGFTLVNSADFQTVTYKIASGTESGLTVGQSATCNGFIATAIIPAGGGGGATIPIMYHHYQTTRAA